MTPGPLTPDLLRKMDAYWRAVSSELAADRAVLFSVSDTGIGTARQNHDRIFGEFAQLRVATTVRLPPSCVVQ